MTSPDVEIVCPCGAPTPHCHCGLPEPHSHEWQRQALTALGKEANDRS